MSDTNIIQKISKKNILTNKKKNIVLIIAVALTTILFTTIFTIKIGMSETDKQENFRKIGGSTHGSVKYLTMDEYNRIKTNKNIKKSGFSIFVGTVVNDELGKIRTEVNYAQEIVTKWSFTNPDTGRMPKEQDEIVTDTLVLDMLGITHTLNQKINLHVNIAGKIVEKDFKLVGFWEHDNVSELSNFYVSKDFINIYLKNIDVEQIREGEDYKSVEGAGLVTAEIMFNSEHNMQMQLQEVINQSKCSVKAEGSINEAYATSDTIWSEYINIILLVLLIVLVGYLIIYNIFNLTMLQDIHFYGLLKSIGATTGQLAKIMKRQAILISVIGIPIGISLGYVIGMILLPLYVKTTGRSVNVVYPFNFAIFIFAIIFSFLTVMFSCGKSISKIKRISPIEALRIVDIDNNKTKKRKVKKGNYLINLALFNFTRNKMKTSLVVMSLALSLILINSIFTYTKCFDIDKYVREWVVSDFQVGHYKLIKDDSSFQDKEIDIVSTKMLKGIKKTADITEGGELFFEGGTHKLSDDGKSNINSVYTKDILEDQKTFYEEFPSWVEQVKDTGKIGMALYGMDNYLIKKLNIRDGILDYDKFKTGKFIIIISEYENWDTFYHVGDKVTITNQKKENKEYEVMCVTNGFAEPLYVNSKGMNGSDKNNIKFSCVLPSSEFKNIISDPLLVSYYFDVKSTDIRKVQHYLENYTTKVEPTMDYTTKQVYIDEFQSIINNYAVVGGGLTGIIFLIGILNFINSVLTSINSRRKEFAVLESIGMTNKQMKIMLIVENLFLGVTVIICSLIGCSLFSILIIKRIAGGVGYYTYNFTLTSFIVMIPILILILLLAPVLSYKKMIKESIVDRLKNEVK